MARRFLNPSAVESPSMFSALKLQITEFWLCRPNLLLKLANFLARTSSGIPLARLPSGHFFARNLILADLVVMQGVLTNSGHFLSEFCSGVSNSSKNQQVVTVFWELFFDVGIISPRLRSRQQRSESPPL